jgi:hypothetical protein
MTDDMMDIDPPVPAPEPKGNTMSALMAGAAREKGKGRAEGMSEADEKAMKEKEGLPW